MNEKSITQRIVSENHTGRIFTRKWVARTQESSKLRELL